MGAYISNQVKMHAYHLNFETLDNGFWNLDKGKFWQNPSRGRPTWNGQDWNCFHFWEFFNLARPPMRIRPPEKSLYFSPLSSAPSSPQPSKVVFYPTFFWVRLRALTSFPFECAFEPSTIKGSAFPILPPLECAFEPSPYFFSSAPSSPRPSKVVHFLSYLLLSASSSPHFLSSTPLSPHFLRASISWIVRLRALSWPSWKKSAYFSPWAGNPLQCDQLGR